MPAIQSMSSVDLGNYKLDTSASMVRVPCPVCTTARSSYVRTLRGFSLERCLKCGLVFVNPQFSGKDLQGIYKERIDPQALIDYYASTATPALLASYDAKLAEIEAFVPGKGRLLDFACGAGYLFERAARRGWEAHGLDIGEWVRSAAEARGLKNIHVGTLREQGFPEGYFDVIYAAQVLEHLPLPLNDLAELRLLLRPNGILYVDVPNYQTLPILLNRDDFQFNNPPGHVNYFTPRTLRNTLERAGFNVSMVATEGGLKWENLIGLQKKAPVANAHGTGNRPAQPTAKPAQPAAPEASLGKQLLRPMVSSLLYRWAKVGMNLYAMARRPQGSGPGANR